MGGDGVKTEKPWYTSKTLWANLVLQVLAVVFGELGKIPQTAEYAVVAQGVVNQILRFVTSTKITG